MTGRILLIDDAANWYESIASALEDEGYKVVWANGRVRARQEIDSGHRFDVAMVNLNLISDFPVPDGQGYLILQELEKKWPELPKIALSAFDKPDDSTMAEKVSELYYRYNVKYVAIKSRRGFVNHLVNAINEIVSGCAPQIHKEGEKQMGWETIVALAVATMLPYIVEFAKSAASETGKETVKVASEGVKALAQKAWQWLEHTVSESGSESDKEVWENFKKKPKSYKDALAGVILRLCPNEDVVLRGYTEGVIQAVEQREGAQIYVLLEKKFMRGDIEEMASRITSEWKDKVSVNYNKTELANWVIGYSQTRNLLSELIAAMLIVNPSVVLE